MAGEFGLIDDYFSWPSQSDSVVLGVGDDAAVLAVSSAHELVVSVDTLVSGIHYPIDTTPEDIGYKALMVNLSDIAAMGAVPRWFTLALTLPEYNAQWLAGFSLGLRQAAEAYDVSLVGGDTTRGACTVSIQIMGEVPIGKALTRSSAQLGDSLYITNALGDAAAGLHIHQERLDVLSDEQRYCTSRLNRPTARVAESCVIRQYANACMDISDGLLQDLSHILKASRLGAVIETSALTFSAALDCLYPMEQDKKLKLALSGGDDYELLFSIPKQNQAQFVAEMQQCGFAFQCIGTLTGDIGNIVDEAGNRLSAEGFQHF
ncbi:MAG: thiamine-phosphate kinase [Leucothrix sp.]